jgi:hypothetical protein
MNRQELRLIVREVLREPVPARWSDALLNTYINNAIGEVEKALMRTKTDTADVEAGQETVSLPEDCYALNSLHWVGSGEIKRQYSGVPDMEEGVTEIPDRYWLIDNKVYLRPTPKEPGTVKFEYYYKLPRFITDDDVLPLDGLDNFVKAHTVFEAYFDDGDPRFEIWKQRKNEELATWMTAEISSYSTGFKVEERW